MNSGALLPKQIAIIGAALVGAGALALAAAGLRGSAFAQNAGDGDYAKLVGDRQVSDMTLRGAINPLFEEKAVGKTQAVLILHNEKIIAERYGEGITRETPLLSRSIAKSVTAVLVGLMVSDGRLALDAPVPLDAWGAPGDPRGAITLRHLLTMTSGLQHREDGEPLASADTVRMLFTDGAQDMARFAEDKPIAAPPGAEYRYSTADTMIISDLMTRMLTGSANPKFRRDAMHEFIHGRLADPIGIKHLFVEYDPRGTMIGGAMMHMTARDYGQFGQFLLQKGRMKGRQILSPRWIEFMTTPSDKDHAYGGGIWLNREGSPSALFDGRGSKRLFACVGRNGQYVIVSPAQSLVIVRMGVTPNAKLPALKAALFDLVRTFPEG